MVVKYYILLISIFAGLVISQDVSASWKDIPLETRLRKAMLVVKGTVCRKEVYKNGERYFFIKVEKRLKRDSYIDRLINPADIGPYIYLFVNSKDGLRIFLPPGITPSDSKYFSFPEKLSGIWMLGLKDNKFYVNNPQAYTNESVEKVEAILKKQNPPKNQQFFPKGLLSPSKNHWYSGILSSAQEPSLYLEGQNPSNESYRFIYHHSLSICSELIFRFDKVDNGYRFSCKGTRRTRGAGRNEILLLNQETFFSESELTPLFRSLKHLKTIKERIHGCDGSQWIFESVKNGKYIFFDYWSPTYKTEERKLSDVVNLGNEYFDLLERALDKILQSGKYSGSFAGKYGDSTTKLYFIDGTLVILSPQSPRTRFFVKKYRKEGELIHCYLPQDNDEILKENYQIRGDSLIQLESKNHQSRAWNKLKVDIPQTNGSAK